MGKTSIEWASHSLNFYTHHCNLVSPGCRNCYAKALAERYQGRGAFDGSPGWRGARAARELAALPSGAVVFVNSMSDTYHERVPVRYIHAIHNAAAYLRPDVTFLLLTKRIERAFALRDQLIWPPNLWLGTSVESAEYLWRLDYLLEVPAAGHFVSCEPLLGSLAAKPLSLTLRPVHGLEHYLSPESAPKAPHRLEWVIVGGESGTHHRPFSLDWAREIRDMCRRHNVPFLFKQSAGRWPGQGRELDGRTWDEMPAFQQPVPPSSPAPVVPESPLQLELF